MPQVNIWSLQPAPLLLTEGEVHVWRAFLNCEDKIVRQYEETLASEEVARANRFLSSRDRDSFVATRGILRCLLGKYADRRAMDIEFTYGDQGKPALCLNGLTRSIHFNVSHSHGLALFAFALNGAVGVDVELVRANMASDEIAERYFSPQEVDELKTLPPHLRTEGFFLCWTRKEAYVKARGEGLQIPLKSFSVSVRPDQPERLVSSDSARWHLYSIRPEAQYVGALVSENRNSQIRNLDWKP